MFCFYQCCSSFTDCLSSSLLLSWNKQVQCNVFCKKKQQAGLDQRWTEFKTDPHQYTTCYTLSSLHDLHIYKHIHWPAWCNLTYIKKLCISVLCMCLDSWWKSSPQSPGCSVSYRKQNIRGISWTPEQLSWAVTSSRKTAGSSQSRTRYSAPHTLVSLIVSGKCSCRVKAVCVVGVQ